jgi:hypothetical protein
MYYRRITYGAYQMVLDKYYATRFDKVSAENTIEFLNSIGANVIGQVDTPRCRKLLEGEQS